MALLIVFDVDGTLTESDAVDAELNVRVMGALFDIRDVDTDWSHYPHTTDGAIFDACFARRWGHPPDAAARRLFEDRLGDALEETLAAAPHRSPPVPGAPAMLAALAARDGVTLALASGAFERSVLAKVRAAGLEAAVAPLPRATGSDARTRAEIVTLARRRAGPAATAVSIGDGVWDVATARELGLRFVGVGAGPGRARLVAAGAARVVEDYRDMAAFLGAVGVEPE